MDAFLDELYLVAPYRGQGIGRRAVQFVLQEAARLDIRAVHLEVERHNEAAKRIYREAGFKDHDRHLMTAWLPPLSDTEV